jgi:hypothetical protein
MSGKVGNTWSQEVGVGFHQVVPCRVISPAAVLEIGLHITTETQMETMMEVTLLFAKMGTILVTLQAMNVVMQIQKRQNAWQLPNPFFPLV